MPQLCHAPGRLCAPAQLIIRRTWNLRPPWNIGDGEPKEIREPDDTRWGVYQVFFPRVVRTTDDLIACFRTLLPQLQCIY